ncbi:hypothetical protein IWQ62_002836 [Dispira parvispora]|uniref:THO complex subunit 1 n=1 Tax=Dispira parvispora TaxID=1520584 RepID=A0A9W8E734_9FUNG|nr:hypothetical protein IWQ62_002836 [Dispira parvispora]
MLFDDYSEQVQQGLTAILNSSQYFSSNDQIDSTQDSLLMQAVAQHLSPLAPPTEPSTTVSSEVFRTALECVFRDQLIQLSQDYARLERFLDVVLACEKTGLCDPSFPFLLVEHFCETQTLDAVVRLFDYLERRKQIFSRDMVATRGKGLVLLRLCNELLRRTSLTQHATFAGRVLILLASVFPLSDRSGVNLRGDFHVENTTEYATDPSVQTDPPGHEILYQSLWSIQAYFAQPSLLFDKQSFGKFQRTLTTVLDEFQRVVNESRTTETSQSPSPDILSAESPVDQAPWNPKYLTNPSLLLLQIVDAQFRRQVMVQVLIVFKYLLLFTPENKQQSIVPGRPVNKQLQHTYTLEPAAQEWVLKTQESVLDFLRDTCTTGKEFTKAVLLILRHDEHWVQWKQANCPPIELNTVLSELLQDFQVQVTDLRAATPNVPMRFAVGTNELTALWCMNENHLEELSTNRLQNAVPNLESFLFDVADEYPQPDEWTDLTEEAKDYHHARMWQALRLASQSHLKKFPKAGPNFLKELCDEVIGPVDDLAE